MRQMRRWILGMGITGLVLAGLATVGAQSQPNGGPGAANLSSVKIIEDSVIRRRIEAGRDCIKDKVWDQAVETLQSILNDPKDHYVRISETDATGRRTVERWTSAKFEANNLLGGMEPEGLEAYETIAGGKAKTMLDEAKKSGDRDILADVAQRYRFTKAGVEANEILATLYLARGQVFTAALRYEKLLQMNPALAKVSDLTLFKAALAFHRAGDKEKYETAWQRLENKLKDAPGLKVGADVVPIAALKKAITENTIVDVVNVHDWPSWRGNDKNAAQANGSPPLLDTTIFTRKMFGDSLEGLGADNDAAAEARVRAVMKQVSDANQPVLPGFFPIVSQGIMVYRSHRDVRAVALKNISIPYEDRKAEFKAGEIIWKSMDLNRSLSVLLEKNDTRQRADAWITEYNRVAGFNSFLYDNTVIGTLATDHRYVFAINDLAVPPHPNVFTQIAFNNVMWNPQNLKPLMMQNQLLAFDLYSGKQKWELNNDDAKSEDPEFKNSHFLSLPISIGGKLYVLNERLLNTNAGAGNPFIGGRANPYPGDSELRLVCIDPTKINGARPAIVGPIQVLGTVSQDDRFLQDITRRVNAVQLAFGEGILVCPTNAGEVFGIDVVTRSLVWSYPYRESNPPNIVLPGQFNPRPVGKGKIGNFGTTQVSNWKSTPPAIADGRVVFTAPDADSIHCVNLRDGRAMWRKGQQKGDLFFAGVFDGRAIVVGENTIRALDLKDGSMRWSAPTGDLPSGQGLASKGIYYQPLRRGEILAIDIASGQIKAHNRTTNPGMAPGNLVFYEGMVLTQTCTEVMAYPQLSVRLGEAKLAAAKDPDNLQKLTDYGELLLKDGQVQLAVDNLMRVYNTNPADPLGKRVKDRLFEALTDLMQTDFSKTAENHLTVYKTLCSVPGNATEQEARQAKYFRLVGQGREAQGRLVEAFDMYKEFGGLPSHRDRGVPSAEDPNQLIPVNVWLRGRIAGMLAKAPLESKAPLEAKIAEEWKIVEAKKDADAIRSFVGMFDVPVRVGREARIRLAETIMERNERKSFLEAELALQQVMGSDYRTDPQSGGRALAALAMLEEKKGTIDSMRLAAAYYRQLGQEFGAAKVRGEKTGADLVNHLATDKRFLPFLETPSSSWGPVKLAARDLGAGNFNIGMQGFAMIPEGDDTPFARQHRLLLDPSDTINPRVRLRDINTNQDRWVSNLGHVPMNQQIFYHLYQQSNPNQGYHPNARFRFYQVKGHLIVCQVGVMVYCIDGDSGKKLWEMQTVENIVNNGLINLQQVTTDAEGNPEFLYRNQQTGQTFRMTLGRVGAAQASYVAVLSHKGLTAVDPLRGTIMWKKPDVSVNSHVFGDDQYLFLAEANDNGAIGAGRVLRANDGEVVNAKDFSNVYQSRLAIIGRRILAAQTAGGNLNVRLYDIVTGKDVWSKAFAPGSFVLKTEDANITGVVDPKGQLTVLEADTGKELLSTNIVQGRVTLQDIQDLREPLLLQDGERFYVALNHAVNRSRVSNGQLHNNFNNGTRCLQVNGWFVAVHRKDGKRTLGEREISWKKGDLAWHTYMPVANQMIVLEQFENSPIVLFTARYNEVLPNGGNRWISVTQSFSKANGKMIYDSGARGINGYSPMFSAFRMDLKSRTVNLIGFSGSVQHYIDDGKAPPNPQGVGLSPIPPGGLRDPNVFPGNPGFAPPNGLVPPNVRPPVIIRRNIAIPNLPPVPAPIKRNK